ncbi:hypothetical protein [Asticcacaulis sp.]|uniref:hypothetical protein n=1 Tax=Asticcacaulis sp. TaxID=1872648 RepID=UPI0031D88BA0
MKTSSRYRFLFVAQFFRKVVSTLSDCALGRAAAFAKTRGAESRRSGVRKTVPIWHYFFKRGSQNAGFSWLTIVISLNNIKKFGRAL